MSKNDSHDLKRHMTARQSDSDSVDGLPHIPHKVNMITASQCRAARGLLNWTQGDLARHAKVGVVTIRQFELGKTGPLRATLAVLKDAFEKAGVEFIGDHGVSIKQA
jgi:hypothetical protein